MTNLRRDKVEILAISVDNQAESKGLVEMLRERFDGQFDVPLLEDKDHRVIDRYGILNPDGRGWPHPATFVIDPQGIVRWKFVELDYRKRPTHQEILRELEKIK